MINLLACLDYWNKFVMEYLKLTIKSIYLAISNYLIYALCRKTIFTVLHYLFGCFLLCEILLLLLKSYIILVTSMHNL
jgi:hypothetical protein